MDPVADAAVGPGPHFPTALCCILASGPVGDGGGVPRNSWRWGWRVVTLLV